MHGDKILYSILYIWVSYLKQRYNHDDYIHNYGISLKGEHSISKIERHDQILKDCTSAKKLVG